MGGDGNWMPGCAGRTWSQVRPTMPHNFVQWLPPSLFYNIAWCSVLALKYRIDDPVDAFAVHGGAGSAGAERCRNVALYWKPYHVSHRAFCVNRCLADWILRSSRSSATRSRWARLHRQLLWSRNSNLGPRPHHCVSGVSSMSPMSWC